jgi:hypothetical protein
MSASSSAPGLFGSALQNTYGTASYGDSYWASPNRVNNRFNAPPSAGGGAGEEDDAEAAYRNWLNWMTLHGWKFGTTGGEGIWNFGNEETYNAFLAWYKAFTGHDYDPNDPTTDPQFTYDQWIKWFTSNGGSHTDGSNTYNFTPVGDILPLVLIALIYLLFMVLRRRHVEEC